MAGNSFGQAFVVTTFGESHGPALGAIVDGCPPGMALSEADLQVDLDRRRPGQSKYTTQRQEPDQVRILSGVFEGRTTGTAIGLLIENVDQKSKDYTDIKDVFRPAHADFTYHHKYGIRDYRGGGRASARETAMRVAAGAIARKYLAEQAGIQIRGHLSAIGNLDLALTSWTAVAEHPFFCGDPTRVDEIAELIDTLRREGNSIGAEVTVVATGMPTVKLAQRTFRFDVQESFKGLKRTSVLVSSPLTSAECGTTVALGKTYLVAAYGSEQAPFIQSCDRPEDIDFVAARIAILRANRLK